MHNPHFKLTTLTDKPKNIAILTMVETITGLCSAVITPKKGPTEHQMQHLKRFVMEHGFANSIIQIAGGNAITEARRSSLNKLHNSLVFQRGRVQHMIIVVKEQWSSRAVPSDLVCTTEGNKVSGHHIWDCNITTFPSASLPWLLQHSIFIIDRFLLRSNDQTSFAANYGYNYTAALLNFGRLSMRTSSALTTGSWPSATNIKRSQASG